MREKGYTADQSELGNVYYPAEGVSRAENVSVNYVEYPWITCFEVEGLDIIKSDQKIWQLAILTVMRVYIVRHELLRIYD